MVTATETTEVTATEVMEATAMNKEERSNGESLVQNILRSSVSLCNPVSAISVIAVTVASVLSVTVFSVASATAAAAEQTWTGKISDSACGAKHEEAAEGQGKMPDRECTQACIRGGSSYVFVTDGKVYRITNQKHEDLAVHAGHAVKLTGELSGATITVSKIVMAD